MYKKIVYVYFTCVVLIAKEINFYFYETLLSSIGTNKISENPVVRNAKSILYFKKIKNKYFCNYF